MPSAAKQARGQLQDWSTHERSMLCTLLAMGS